MQKTLSSFKKILRSIPIGFLLALFCAGSVWAQERTVSGKVISADDGQGFPGVNIIVKGTTLGTVSDKDGKFSINAPSPESVLVFSSIGFASSEIVVGTQSVIDITLNVDVTSLSEVIVTGYGNQ